MLAVAISEAAATKLIAEYKDVYIAAINATNSVTLAGLLRWGGGNESETKNSSFPTY
jgi:hypothetical protein